MNCGTRKKIATLFIASAIMGIVSYNQCKKNQLTYANPLMEENLEALAEENPWQGKSLKCLKCTCQDGKEGYTLRCRKDGSGEKCTETQQGFKGCYKTVPKLALPPVGVKLCDLKK